MEGNFSKILALVDFSENSKHAAEEAAMIASKFGSELHLLHVSSHSRRSYLFATNTYLFDSGEHEEEAYYKNTEGLKKINLSLQKRYEVSAGCFEKRGDFIEVVKKHVRDFQINLVVLGSKKRKRFDKLLSQNKAKSIIGSLQCEVLCVNPESDSKKIKTIVLPIGKYIPQKRIRLAYELAKKFTARIHLIALNMQDGKSNGEYAKTLIASYRCLKDVSNMPIECNTVQGKNLAEASMNYAKVVGADLILINEGAESDLNKNIISTWRGNIVNNSSVPVLSVCIP